MSDEDLVVVVASNDRIELDLARNLLDAAGIPCVVELGSGGAYLQAVYGAAFTGPGHVSVRRKDLERADAVLAEAWGRDEEDG